ncbi:MAG: hypothetical protein J6V40_04825 [Clostridia bacterium]|nr:hypothetical protein [Clostridia bacterium]
MGNLLLNVGLLGGIWNFISGTIAKIGAALSSSFVPVADSIWATSVGVLKAVPAFCMAHPGAIVLGAVSLFAGVKIVKGIAKKFKDIKSKVKVAVATRQAEKQMEKQMVQEAVAVKSAEKASSKTASSSKPKEKAAAKDIVFNPVQDYLANVSCDDNLDAYKSYRAQKASTPAAPQVSTSRAILTPRDNSLFTLEESMGR